MNKLYEKLMFVKKTSIEDDTIIEDNTYILVDEQGNELPVVLTEEKVDLTAEASDIRIGKTAVIDDGVVIGTGSGI